MAKRIRDLTAITSLTGLSFAVDGAGLLTGEARSVTVANVAAAVFAAITGAGNNRVVYLDSSQVASGDADLTFNGTQTITTRVGPNTSNYIYSLPTGDGDISFRVNALDFANFVVVGTARSVNWGSLTTFQVAGNTVFIMSDTSTLGMDIRVRTSVPVGGATVSTNLARVGGVIFDQFADVATTHTDGTEDDLFTNTLPASALSTNGDKISAEYCLVLVSSATATRRVKAYYGGTLVLDSGTQTFAAAGTANIWLTVIRESSTIVRVKAELVVAGITLQPVVTYTRITGLTLTNTQVLKLTGIAAGTGAGASDIVAKLGYGEWKPAA